MNFAKSLFFMSLFLSFNTFSMFGPKALKNLSKIKLSNSSFLKQNLLLNNKLNKNTLIRSFFSKKQDPAKNEKPVVDYEQLVKKFKYIEPEAAESFLNSLEKLKNKPNELEELEESLKCIIDLEDAKISHKTLAEILRHINHYDAGDENLRKFKLFFLDLSKQQTEKEALEFSQQKREEEELNELREGLRGVHYKNEVTLFIVAYGSLFVLIVAGFFAQA